MVAAAAEHPSFGAISAVTNIAGNPAQYPAGVGLREDRYVAFVCVLITRRAWEQIGPLDERYCLDYGVEDRDYCHRLLEAGMKVGIYDFCFVDHACLHSSFRGHPSESASFARNWALFQEKWGIA
jgi:GT2 family glycosyltransferase